MKRYTPGLTRWFLQAIDDLEREAHRGEVIGARMAQAPAKALEQYFSAIADRS